MDSLPVSIKNRLNSRHKRSIRSSRSGPSRPPVQQLSALGLTATALACQLLPTPAKAYQVFFTAPNCPAGYYWDGTKCKYLVAVPTNLPVPHGQTLITPPLVSIPIDQVKVWSDLQRSMEASATPVPGPLPLAGAWVGWRWARRLRRLTHQG